jgi:hypothetical protein
MEKKLYLVEVLSTFRLRYVVEAHEEEHAHDEVVCREGDAEFHEFSQEHLGTQIFSSRKLSATDYLKITNIFNRGISKTKCVLLTQ